MTGGGTVIVRLCDDPIAATVLPASVLHYVLRTRETVILDDAGASPFAADPYIRERRARSVLCLPLVNQGKPVGVLYLENNLAPGVFAPARITVLKLLVSQTAITLENTRPVPRPRTTRSQNPAPGRCQHYWDRDPNQRRFGSRGQ